jgi:hypothetical protein
MKIFSVFSIFVLLLFSGCKKDINNQLPFVEFSYQVIGLQLDMAGYAYDLDGQMVSLEIKWGDGNTFFTETAFSDIRVSHIYDEPGTYDVVIKGIDNLNGATTLRFTIPVVPE